MSVDVVETKGVKALEHYDMSEAGGFLCRHNAGAVRLEGAWRAAADIALDLPNSLVTGRVRSVLTSHLPDPDLVSDASALTEAEVRMALVHYSFMVQAYVWGEAEPADRLPAALARPIVGAVRSFGSAAASDLQRLCSGQLGVA